MVDLATNTANSLVSGNQGHKLKDLMGCDAKAEGKHVSPSLALAVRRGEPEDIVWIF